MSPNRFAKQIVLPEIGPEGQRRIQDARVLCVGVGGLGCPATLYLAAAGIGTIGLVDGDRVQLSNLPRQILFDATQVGSFKVSSAQARLQGMYPDVKIEIYPEALDETNAINLLERFDLVIDGTDNFATKFLINAAARKVGIPMIYGAVTGFEGEVALFGGDSACYRCLRSAPPQAPIQNCAEAGVLGSVVGVIGTMQATLALEFILSRGESHSLSPQKGSLTLVDLRGSWKIQTLKIPRRPNCPVCSVAQKEVILPSSLPEICSSVSSITAHDLQARMSTPHQRLCLIDVRELPEWSEGHLEGARFFPLSKIQSGELPSFPPETSQIVLYCQKGVRSAKAAELLAEKGTRNVWHLTGGLESWQGPLIRSS